MQMYKPGAIFGSVIALFSFLPMAASAQSVSASNPSSVVAALQKQGYEASLGQDAHGDPLIYSGSGGVEFQIQFYGCNGGVDCQDIMFHAGFSTDQNFAMSSANDWNKKKLVGKVHVDDVQDPIILHFVAGVDGMSSSNFARLMKRWDTALSEFTDHINW